MRNNKLFFIKTVVFLLPLLIAAGFVELRLRTAPSSYAFKRRLIDQVGSKARVLVFGTSHAYYDFNPEFFSMPGFNLANTSQSLVLDQQIFARFLPLSDSVIAMCVTPGADSGDTCLYSRSQLACTGRHR